MWILPVTPDNQLKAIELTGDLPREVLNDFLIGSGAEVLVVDDTLILKETFPEEYGKEDEESELDLGDWLVRIGDDILTYDAATFDQHFSV